MDAEKTVLLQFQELTVKDARGRDHHGNGFFDPGSTTCLVRQGFVDRLGLVGKDCTQLVQPAGHPVEKWETKAYLLQLPDRKGVIENVLAYSLQEITGDIDEVDLLAIKELFPNLAEEQLKRPAGAVDILIGVNYAHLHPVPKDVVGDMRLLESRFGSGIVIDGSHPRVKCMPIRINHLAHKFGQARQEEVRYANDATRVNHIRMKKPKSNFLELEELGTAPPKRCPSHVNCQKCSHQALAMTQREQHELKLICEGMIYNKDEKTLSVHYPVIGDLSKLEDNRVQAIRMAEHLERRLRKQGHLEAYNREMQEFIDRGVFREVTNEEMRSWEGAVNYISHHGVEKSASATTPLHVVSNSSLSINNSGVSYNRMEH